MVPQEYQSQPPPPRRRICDLPAEEGPFIRSKIVFEHMFVYCVGMETSLMHPCDGYLSHPFRFEDIQGG